MIAITYYYTYSYLLLKLIPRKYLLNPNDNKSSTVLRIVLCQRGTKMKQSVRLLINWSICHPKTILLDKQSSRVAINGYREFMVFKKILFYYPVRFESDVNPIFFADKGFKGSALQVSQLIEKWAIIRLNFMDCGHYWLSRHKENLSPQFCSTVILQIFNAEHY